MEKPGEEPTPLFEFLPWFLGLELAAYSSFCEGAVSAAQTMRPVANAIKAHNKINSGIKHRTAVGAPLRPEIAIGSIKKTIARRGTPFNSSNPMRWMGR